VQPAPILKVFFR